MAPPRPGLDRAFRTIVVRMATNSSTSLSSGTIAFSRSFSDSRMSRSQYRASRDSFNEMQLRATKSAFDCPAVASSRFAPIEVDDCTSWIASRRTTEPRCSSSLHNSTARQENRKVRCRRSSAPAILASSARGVPCLRSAVRTQIATERRVYATQGLKTALSERSSVISFRCVPARSFCLLPFAFCRLPSAVCRLPSAVCRLPSAVCRLPSAFCLDKERS